MSPRYRVLIVDESAESREVLRTALERDGTDIFEASRADQGLALARTCRPDLIVLDMEAETVGATDLAEDFRQTTEATGTPVLVLATARKLAGGLPRGEFVAKPYHFGPLIRRIEELLDQRS